jgi:hypothetical protein
MRGPKSRNREFDDKLDLFAQPVRQVVGCVMGAQRGGLG